MLLVCRFDAAVADDHEAFLARARRAVTLLAAQSGCDRVEFGRAVEAPDQWVLVAVFASLTDYRRALSPFEVREHVVPFLAAASTADEATFERRLTGYGPGGVGGAGYVEHASILD